MKDILVTGAYGGMGRATVKLLRDNGYRVFALDLQCDGAEYGIIPVEFDITSEESVKQAYNKVASYTDNLFAIIHFAGMYSLDSLVEMGTMEFCKIFDVLNPDIINNLKTIYNIHKQNTKTTRKQRKSTRKNRRKNTTT